MNFLDRFAHKLQEKREQKKITQRELADRLNMRFHTIIEIENCKSNTRFETVALIAEEMNISLDGIVFHDKVSQTVPKCVVDFFANKSEKQSRHTEIHRFMSKCGKATINSYFQNCSIEKQKGQ